MRTDDRNLLLLVWTGPVGIVTVLIGWMVLAGFLPPPSPAMSPDGFAAMWAQHTELKRLGMILCVWGGALYVPFTVAVAMMLRRAESEADQLRVRAEADKAVNELEGRVADLRHIEADLETIRQAHYAAGDQVNQAQGKLYEATAEVGKLEAEIRYVVEGRQRVEQRLVQLAEQIAQWQARKEDADVELENLAGAGVDAEERAELLAAPEDEELDILDVLGAPKTHRLACCLKLKAGPGLVVLKPVNDY